MPQKPRNADYTKEYNRKSILRILRHNAMSRAELARATGLTRAATSLIVDELLKGGIGKSCWGSVSAPLALWI